MYTSIKIRHNYKSLFRVDKATELLKDLKKDIDNKFKKG
jgi:hypothetical protein